MAFPPQFLDELRARTPVSGVAASRLRLIKRGREYTALCPFHAEKTPSFTINDDKGFYHCFGCGAHGDVISFVMQTEGLAFPEAIEKLAAAAGLEVPRPDPAERARVAQRAGLYEVVEAACDWFSAQLAGNAGAAARAYLADRGIDDALIGRFRLGFAPDGRGRLAQALAAKGITTAQLAEAGLVKLPEDDAAGAPRDYFFNRVIFPIGDRRGRIIAFGGRTLGEARPKYLNSPDTPLFCKGETLYNAAAARSADTVIVVEGYTDVIALARAGRANAVAPLGTALTEAQLAELWRIADEPVLCFDGDTAGERAAFRAAERALPLLRPGKSLAIAMLPAGEDPDSFVAARGIAAFDALVTAAAPLAEVVWRAVAGPARFDTPERRALFERQLEERVRAIADGAIQTQYRSELRHRRQQLYDQLFAGRRGGPAARALRRPQTGLRHRGDIAALTRQQERILLALLINHPGLLIEFAEQLATVTLRASELDSMLREILKLAGSAGQLDTATVQRHLNDTGFDQPLQSVVTAKLYRQAGFAAPDAAPSDAAAALADVLEWYRRHRLADDRIAAERAFARDGDAAASDRLVGVAREQIDGERV